MGLFGPPNIEKLRAKGNIRKLVKSLTYGETTSADLLVRESAAKALDELGWRPDSEEEEIAYCIATQKWERCGGKGEAGIEALTRVLKGAANAGPRDLEDREAFQRLLLDTFEGIGAPAVEPLIKAFEDTQNHLAATALARIGDLRATGPLCRALKLPRSLRSMEKRRAAAEALGYLPDPNSVEPLVAALDDDSLGITALEALGRLGPQLKDPETRQRVIEVLSGYAKYAQTRRREVALEGLKGFRDLAGRTAYLSAREVVQEEERAKEEHRRRLEEEAAAREAARARMKRGGLGEPYCSQACFEQGAQFALLDLGRPSCGVCGQPVPVSQTGRRTYAVVPFQGKALVVCQNCTGKAEQRLRGHSQCSVCQRPL